ncbi:MAG: hypothetical protein KGI84_07895, partial [Elusimicrobia bacterium]|nr:hypothetical protein [Elusimicrobiota bacterium]
MARGKAARAPPGERGSILLETVLAIVIMTVVGLSLVSLIGKATQASLAARRQMTCGTLAQSAMS